MAAYNNKKKYSVPCRVCEQCGVENKKSYFKITDTAPSEA